MDSAKVSIRSRRRSLALRLPWPSSEAAKLIWPEIVVLSRKYPCDIVYVTHTYVSIPGEGGPLGACLPDLPISP